MTSNQTHWGKLYGSLCLHPKWLATPAEGRALWTSALSYCIVIGSDGDIPEGVLHMLNAPGASVEASVEQLLNSGLWVKSDKGYSFHDWDTFQQTVEERKSVRAKRSEAGKASAEARRRAKSQADDNTSSTSVETPVEDLFSKRPTEKRREEKRREEESSSATRKKPARPIPEDWTPTDEHKAKAAEKGLDLAREAEAFKLHAEAHDRRAVRWNAAFSQWLVKATPRQPTIPMGRPTQGSWMTPRKAS